MGATRALLTVKLSDSSTLYINCAVQAQAFLEKICTSIQSGSSQTVCSATEGESTNEELTKLQKRLLETEALWQKAYSSVCERLDMLDSFLREAPFEHFKHIDQAISSYAATVCGEAKGGASAVDARFTHCSHGSGLAAATHSGLTSPPVTPKLTQVNVEVYDISTPTKTLPPQGCQAQSQLSPPHLQQSQLTSVINKTPAEENLTKMPKAKAGVAPKPVDKANEKPTENEMNQANVLSVKGARAVEQPKAEGRSAVKPKVDVAVHAKEVKNEVSITTVASLAGASGTSYRGCDVHGHCVFGCPECAKVYGLCKG
eukprot:gnl/MRDRNA2_/MRDRNA2_95319_c0_seq1.p1 gnl/MRDRNA2_/MRDRNA2_95319_c0~~gnl/MRDRNA2_/MRDRNA2_95319_c0_seq1.p1  ORF type:complete len:315 (+),score=58.22 gnl/MRDRNA2_/MRDRNA2_95319_c0_seq1:88-1032(+)